MSKFQQSDLDSARDELMSHIARCEVLRASSEQQEIWMDDTMEFMAERYPALSPAGLDELRAIGMRFCQPVIQYGKQYTALTERGDANQHAELTTAV